MSFPLLKGGCSESKGQTSTFASRPASRQRQKLWLYFHRACAQCALEVDVVFPFDETISVGDVLAVLAAPAGSRGEAARFDVSP